MMIMKQYHYQTLPNNLVVAKVQWVFAWIAECPKVPDQNNSKVLSYVVFGTAFGQKRCPGLKHFYIIEFLLWKILNLSDFILLTPYL